MRIPENIKLMSKEIELLKQITKEEEERWREVYTPNLNHKYYEIQTINHLNCSPLSLRVSANRYEEIGRPDIALSFRKQSVFTKVLLYELERK